MFGQVINRLAKIPDFGPSRVIGFWEVACKTPPKFSGSVPEVIKEWYVRIYYRWSTSCFLRSTSSFLSQLIFLLRQTEWIKEFPGREIMSKNQTLTAACLEGPLKKNDDYLKKGNICTRAKWHTRPELTPIFVV